MAKKRPRVIQMTLENWQLAMGRARTREERGKLGGLSPGGAAAELDISRRAVYYAVERGELEMVRVHDRVGHLLFVMVTDESLVCYKAQRASQVVKESV